MNPEPESSTVERVPTLYEVATAASLDTPDTYPVERVERTFKKRPSLFRALTVAANLSLARLDEELFRPRGYDMVAQSPYMVLVTNDDDEPFTPILAFSLGSHRIPVPRLVRLSSAALRTLAVGKIAFNPVALEFEE